MGKNLIVQKRGRGTSTYRAPSFRYLADVRHVPGYEDRKGTILDIVHCQGHSAPLLKLDVDNIKDDYYMIAPEGVKVGDSIELCSKTLSIGNSLLLKDIPEGTPVFNIEAIPGDGGKYIRSTGGSARVTVNSESRVVIQFPSKKTRVFSPLCKATIGTVAGGGRTEKPLVKAGNNYYKKKATNKLYPVVSASAMNAVDHPYGNKRTLRKAKNKPTSRSAPPGRKVGKIAAKRTGRSKK
jgi:large subunit ribosomal protein L2